MRDQPGSRKHDDITTQHPKGDSDEHDGESKNRCDRTERVGAGAGDPAPAKAIGDAENRTARMVGGGWVAVGDFENHDGGNRVSLGVDLPCPGEDIGFNPQPDPPGRLQVTWAANNFHLDTVTAASCTNNLHEGSGTGRCGDDVGFVINWRLTDGNRQGVGNPDIRPDTVQLDIGGPSAACALSLSGPLGGGNLKMTAPPEPE